MKYPFILFAIALSLPTHADNNPAVARAICLQAAMPSVNLLTGHARDFCADVTSEGQAECLIGALAPKNTNAEERKTFCKQAKTRGEGICMTAAFLSKEVRRGTEQTFCAGMGEAQANCLAAAFPNKEVTVAKGQKEIDADLDYCAEFAATDKATPATAGTPDAALNSCQAKIDNLTDLFNKLDPKIASVTDIKTSVEAILNKVTTPDTPTAKPGGP